MSGKPGTVPLHPRSRSFRLVAGKPESVLFLKHSALFAIVSKRWGDTNVDADHVCAVRPIKPLRGILRAETYLVYIAVAGHDVPRVADFDDSVIKLITNQSVAVSQPYCPRR
jgi:hypothetical protein